MGNQATALVPFYVMHTIERVNIFFLIKVTCFLYISNHQHKNAGIQKDVEDILLKRIRFALKSKKKNSVNCLCLQRSRVPLLPNCPPDAFLWQLFLNVNLWLSKSVREAEMNNMKSWEFLFCNVLKILKSWEIH